MVAKQIEQINATSNKAVLFNIKKDVLYVPKLRGNLKSMKELTRAGIEELFSGSVAVLRKDGKLLATTGHIRACFYEIDLCLEEIDAKRAQLTISRNNSEYHPVAAHGHSLQHSFDRMPFCIKSFDIEEGWYEAECIKKDA